MLGTILSTQSFTLFESIVINVVFWGLIICAIIFLVLYLKFTKDDWKDYDGTSDSFHRSRWG